jgi:hypothetical protein
MSIVALKVSASIVGDQIFPHAADQRIPQGDEGRGRDRGAAVVSVPSGWLPVLARLWRPRHTRKLAELIAARYSDRTVHVVGDACGCR